MNSEVCPVCDLSIIGAPCICATSGPCDSQRLRDMQTLVAQCDVYEAELKLLRAERDKALTLCASQAAELERLRSEKQELFFQLNNAKQGNVNSTTVIEQLRATITQQQREMEAKDVSIDGCFVALKTTQEHVSELESALKECGVVLCDTCRQPCTDAATWSATRCCRCSGSIALRCGVCEVRGRD